MWGLQSRIEKSFSYSISYSYSNLKSPTISLYGACSEDIFSAEEPWVLEVNPDTIGYVWMGEFDLNTLRIRVACEQAHIWGHTRERQRANIKWRRDSAERSLGRRRELSEPRPNPFAIWYSLFAARACAPKCEPARRLVYVWTGKFLNPERKSCRLKISGYPWTGLN